MQNTASRSLCHYTTWNNTTVSEWLSKRQSYVVCATYPAEQQNNPDTDAETNIWLCGNLHAKFSYSIILFVWHRRLQSSSDLIFFWSWKPFNHDPLDVAESTFVLKLSMLFELNVRWLNPSLTLRMSKVGKRRVNSWGTAVAGQLWSGQPLVTQRLNTGLQGVLLLCTRWWELCKHAFWEHSRLLCLFPVQDCAMMWEMTVDCGTQPDCCVCSQCLPHF